MKSNSNLILAVVIIVGFIFLWDSLVVSRYNSSKKTITQTDQLNKNTNFTPKSPLVSSPSSTPLPQTSAPSSTVLQNGEAIVTVDSRGGRVSSWKIKERDHWIELVSPSKTAKRHPLETFPDLNFSVQSASEAKIVLRAQHASGVRILKIFSLGSNPPLHVVSLEFMNPTKSPITIDSSLGWGEGLRRDLVDGDPKKKPAEINPAEMRALALADKVRSWKPGFIFGRVVDQTNLGPFAWAGVDNRHFLAAIFPAGDKIDEIHVFTDKHTPPSVDIPMKVSLDPGATKAFTYDVFVGPKKTSDLKAVGHDLEKSISFGMFGFISKALLRALEFFKQHTGNYGWAIIIVTILLQILVFPLTKKSLNHSVKMKELQPQLKQLQGQFKSDPKRLQIETLNLYKKNGMHFMGLEGCLPILLQIPIFFAFYSALNGAYELRGAPWIFWIKDLAAPDSYHVLPILMGAGMFLQQKLTTVPTDPAQAKMMLFMPVIFVFMFFKMPAGLVLYWTVNSICTILGQRLLLWQKNSSTPSSP